MSLADIPQLHARHGALTDPGALAHLFDDLPAAPSSLCDVLSGLIVHTSWADKYGIPPGTPLPRDTKPAAERLAEIQRLAPGSLRTAREPAQRPFGTCRDYALLACSVLRHRSIPARVRCGFATYFAGRRYADHWICEYWIADEGRWAILDAQLDRLQREQLAIKFDCADLPAGAFLDAASAWVLVRAGAAAADEFGHGDTGGLWFMSVDLHRDLLALVDRQVSAWDSWRSAADSFRQLTADDLSRCDELAAAVLAATASGGTEALRDLAARHDVPPWQARPPRHDPIMSCAH